jgi:hypothetical protein
VRAAIAEGWGQAVRAPWIIGGLFVLTMAAALPAALAIGVQIEGHLGDSLMSERVIAGWDAEWAGEFQAVAWGPARTLTHEILGFGAFLATWDRMLEARVPHRSLLAAVVIYGAIWLWISGGILDRLARQRPIGAARFSAACGVFFFRFLRLSLVVVPIYAALFLWLHPLLFDTFLGWWVRDRDSETPALLLRALLYLGFLAALMLVSVLSDFTKIRMVVEDRRSALASLGASARFIRRRFWRIGALYGLNVLAQAALAMVWLGVAPGAGAPVWVALATSEVYLVVRLWARLGFLASEVAFFQGQLAHAGYTAVPELVWPDSPAVEAIGRLSAPDANRDHVID